MKRKLNLALAVVLSCFVFSNTSQAVLVITPTLPAAEIVEGTSSIDFTLSFTGTGLDQAALFDAFTFAVEATNSRVGGDPVFVKPIAVANLPTALASWQLVDQSSFGAPNQVAGNVNAPQNVSVSLPSDVLSFTLDTRQLIAGDVVTISPNLFGIAAVSFRGAEFTLSPVQSSFSVTAIPEPGSFALLGCISAVLAVRRRSRA